jgi:serine/threonine protein kinase
MHHLVHRDIKPSNLMLVRESDGTLRVKVIDFGLAKFVVSQDEDDSLDGMTLGGRHAGFCEPRATAQRDEDVRSDIYSWELRFGTCLLAGQPVAALLQKS